MHCTLIWAILSWSLRGGARREKWNWIHRGRKRAERWGEQNPWDTAVLPWPQQTAWGEVGRAAGFAELSVISTSFPLALMWCKAAFLLLGPLSLQRYLSIRRIITHWGRSTGCIHLAVTSWAFLDLGFPVLLQKCSWRSRSRCVAGHGKCPFLTFYLPALTLPTTYVSDDLSDSTS